MKGAGPVTLVSWSGSFRSFRPSFFKAFDKRFDFFEGASILRVVGKTCQMPPAEKQRHTGVGRRDTPQGYPLFHSKGCHSDNGDVEDIRMQMKRNIAKSDLAILHPSKLRGHNSCRRKLHYHSLRSIHKAVRSLTVT